MKGTENLDKAIQLTMGTYLSNSKFLMKKVLSRIGFPITHAVLSILFDKTRTEILKDDFEYKPQLWMAGVEPKTTKYKKAPEKERRL